MQEVNINNLVRKNNFLKGNIPNNKIIVGKIDLLNIKYKYDQLDLSRIECDEIYYFKQEGESIKNHILPNSLEKLICWNNRLTLLPNLPNSLIELNCGFNRLTSLPSLPDSLEELSCFSNQLVSLPDLPNSLQYLNFHHNQLTSIPQLPNSLQYLNCYNNQLTSLPDFSYIDHKLELGFHQDLPISYIPYNPHLKFIKFYNNMIIIEGYINNPITNQQELDQYMDYIKKYQLNRIKSARK